VKDSNWEGGWGGKGGGVGGGGWGGNQSKIPETRYCQGGCRICVFAGDKIRFYLR